VIGFPAGFLSLIYLITSIFPSAFTLKCIMVGVKSGVRNFFPFR
jgi:hypothetical protein